MPERTTPRQRMIALVREHLAEPGVNVTESKMLFDQAAGKMREVDVVAEGDIGGDPMVLSVEVVDHKRRATLTWVDQMVGKHSTMPTNKLVLVSWSGFTEAAQAKADALPTVEAISPTHVQEPDGTQRQSEALYLDYITLKATKVVIQVRLPDGKTSKSVKVGRQVSVFDVNGIVLASMGELIDSFLRSENVGRALSVEAHGREDRENLKGFVVAEDSFDKVADLYVREEEPGPPELHQITALRVDGEFRWQQTELRFDVVKISDRAHGIAQIPWLGKDAVWVATPKDGSDEVKISWRTTGSSDE